MRALGKDTLARVDQGRGRLAGGTDRFLLILSLLGLQSSDLDREVVVLSVDTQNRALDLSLFLPIRSCREGPIVVLSHSKDGKPSGEEKDLAKREKEELARGPEE